jgi:hypothetical protein
MPSITIILLLSFQDFIGRSEEEMVDNQAFAEGKL